MQSVFVNGGFIGPSLKFSDESKVVFYDDFETFGGWITQGSGTVSQSSTQKYSGSFSAIKNTANDQNGAYKFLSAPVQRNFVLECWIYSESPRVGGGADRISILDSSNNGYGIQITATALGIERRDAIVGTLFSSQAYTRTENVWYRVVFTANSNNTFTLTTFDVSGNQIDTITSSADTTHTGSFDRVAILGGFVYYVDEMSITKLAPNNLKNSGIWKLQNNYDSEITPRIRLNNVHPNPTDIFAWSGSTGHTACTVSRDTISSPFSNTPLKMAVTGNDPHISTYTISPIWNLFPAANTQKWQVRVFCKASTSTTAQIFIFGANSSGVFAGAGGDISALTYDVTTEWKELILEYTFSNADIAFVQCRLDGPDTGGTGIDLWFDGLQVIRLS
jgi:hypothetical protein